MNHQLQINYQNNVLIHVTVIADSLVVADIVKALNIVVVDHRMVAMIEDTLNVLLS